ncbi:MAG: hypothetical protein K6G81_00160 [Lachnospiraceae bacterium]|nr:hypothetical protein [Lachnospiraceae bacterium]
MKLTAEDMEAKKTALDDDASIYGKRDDRDTKEKLASLKGREKWEFFKDYILWKLVITVAVAGFIGFLLYSVFGPKPETVLYVAVIDDPLGNDNIEKLSEALSGRYVKEPKKEKVMVDGNYYLISGDYNARMKMMTLTAAGEIDFCIIPKNELENYMESEMFASLEDVMEKTALEAYGNRLFVSPADGRAYGINVTSMINSTLGYDIGEDYYAACVINAKHKELFADFTGFILGQQ